MRIKLDNGKTYILNALQVEIMRYSRISHGHWFAPGRRDYRDYVIGGPNYSRTTAPAEEKAMRSLARRGLLNDCDLNDEITWRGRIAPTKFYLTEDFWKVRDYLLVLLPPGR
jgi:hypothetical protein